MVQVNDGRTAEKDPHVIERQTWLRAAVLVGMIYFAVAFASAALAGPSVSASMRVFWRWSAFVVSAVVFGAHIAYEHARPGNPARRTAWHASVAAAIGGFALALAANAHDLGSATGYRPRMLIALAAWPLLTAVPAFVVALVVATGLGLKRSATDRQP